MSTLFIYWVEFDEILERIFQKLIFSNQTQEIVKTVCL